MIGDRLPPPFGVMIDRSRPLAFTFEGRACRGYAGDTLASALIANGIRLIGRSMKYHRPRSVLSLNGSDANLLVTVDGVPNQPAERTPLADGMVAMGQNYKGSLARDRWVLPEFLARYLPVGFYYWAFFRPQGIWRFWEKLIRARAGLGRMDPDHIRRPRAKTYDWADVVVIGAGPSGLAAARAAAGAGAEILLLDGRPGNDQAGTENFRFEPNTLVHGIYGDGWIAASRHGSLRKIRAGRIVLATGSIEQPAVFRNNDRPGIMLGDSAARLVRDYGVRPGDAAVIITSSRDGYGVANTLLDAGLSAVTVVDTRSDAATEALDAESKGAVVLHGYEPMEAIGTGHVTGLLVRAVANPASRKTLNCDLICLCGGRVPDAALWCHAGGAIEYDRAMGRWRLTGDPQHVTAAGAIHGHLDEAACTDDGAAAGRLAAFQAGFGGSIGAPGPALPSGQSAGPIIVTHPRGGEFVDFDEDLTIKDLQAGVAQGFDHAQLLKRYSTLGMGPSQGRHTLLPAMEITLRARGEDRATGGTTTFRPPLHGMSFAKLAGEAFHPERLTPIDGWHRRSGAKMMVAGDWQRPSFYPTEATPDPRMAALEEARWVRNAVGLIDVSTLGKLEIRGADAAGFMDRFYTFRYAGQPVGRLRYVLATDEAGAIIDDGVACRLADDHFYVTTTTGGIGAVYASMLWWNIHWKLDVDITNVTSAHAAVNLAGPLSRRVLTRVTNMDLEPGAFPYLAVRRGEIAGVPARVMRVGFVGELGYEIHVPAGYGLHLWSALLDAGKAEGIRPFGVEAQRLLRLEKGHIIVGQDSDGLTFPDEVGMGWAVADKPEFVGKRSIDIHNRRGLGRKLVGFRLENEAAIPEEGHLTLKNGEIAGRVTSSGTDLQSGLPIGLAFVFPDQARPGSSFRIRIDGGKLVEATVAALPFYDPDNARQEIDP